MNRLTKIEVIFTANTTTSSAQSPFANAAIDIEIEIHRISSQSPDVLFNFGRQFYFYSTVNHD